MSHGLAGVILVVGFFGVGPMSAAGQGVVPPREGLGPAAEQLEAFIRREMEVQGLPAVSIAIVEGDSVSWAKGFGLARPKEKTAATAETIYRVGSVSKLFTDLAVMQLLEEGKVDLDASVTTYLPDFQPKNPFGTPITLRQLMSHRSGLVRESPVGNYFDATSPTLVDTVKSLNATELVYAPGARTKYSNAGVAVAGLVVETIRGEAFAATLKAKVLEPLGMKATSFEATEEVKKGLASAEMWTYDGRTFEAPTFALGTGPAGNMYASALDLGKFLSALFAGGKGPGGRVLKEETLKAMWQPQFAGPGGTRVFGIGFALSTLDGDRRVGHGGAVYGFATELAALPERGVGVAVVISKDCANATATRIADAALRLTLATQRGKPLPPIETTEPLAPEKAKALAGTYENAKGGVVLSAASGRLYMTPKGGGMRLELRSRGEKLAADDPLGFGAKVAAMEGGITLDGAALKRVEAAKPGPAPERWRGLIGEYGWDHNVLYIHEREGKLFALIEWFYLDALEEVSADVYKFPHDRGLYFGEALKFTRDASGRATQVEAASVVFPRRKIDGDDGSTFRIKPVHPVEALREKALRETPPVERGEFRAADLVDVAAMDSTIKLDVRYATTNNFLGTPVYSSARAFFQRPAAEALLRAHRGLKAQGYGLLIHDTYRPWYVTRMFWDATSGADRGFVADPEKGSKHNRGCAVDLSLYHLDSGKPVEMVGGYDEFSERSRPDYPGGTGLQRWHRQKLRKAMEEQGFTVNVVEWWHFDYKDWAKYPILNTPFEKLREP